MIRIRDYMTVNDAIAFADELLFYVKQNGKHNIARHYGMGVRLSARASREGRPPQYRRQTEIKQRQTDHTVLLVFWNNRALHTAHKGVNVNHVI